MSEGVCRFRAVLGKTRGFWGDAGVCGKGRTWLVGRIWGKDFDRGGDRWRGKVSMGGLVADREGRIFRSGVVVLVVVVGADR